MPDGNPAPRGADLARVALNQARADARRRGNAAPARPKRRTRAAASSGRDPVRARGAIEALADQFGWKLPSAGAQVVIRWTELVPEAVGLGSPERYDADTRTLFLRPVSPAAATQLRLNAARIPALLRERTGADTVAAVRVLPPGPARHSPPLLTGPVTAAASPAPPKSRADASPGLLHALELAQVARERGPAPDPQQELRDRYFADARGTLREADERFTDAVVLQEDLAAQAAAAQDTERLALQRARAEKAGRAPALPRAFDRTA